MSVMQILAENGSVLYKGFKQNKAAFPLWSYKKNKKVAFHTNIAILCAISPLLEEHLNNAGLVKPYKKIPVGRIEETQKSTATDGSQDQKPNVIHETVDATDQHSVQDVNLPCGLIDEGFKIAFGYAIGNERVLKDVDMVDLVFAIHAARALRMEEFLDKALMLFQRFETLDGAKSWKTLQAAIDSCQLDLAELLLGKLRQNLQSIFADEEAVMMSHPVAKALFSEGNGNVPEEKYVDFSFQWACNNTAYKTPAEIRKILSGLETLIRPASLPLNILLNPTPAMRMVLPPTIITAFQKMKEMVPAPETNVPQIEGFSTKPRDSVPIIPFSFLIVANGVLNDGTNRDEDFFTQVVHSELRGDLASQAITVMMMFIGANHQMFGLKNFLNEEKENGLWQTHLGGAHQANELTIGDFGQITGYFVPEENRAKLVGGMGTLAIRMTKIFDETWINSELLIQTGEDARRKDNELVIGTIGNYKDVHKFFQMIQDGTGSGKWTRYMDVSFRVEFTMPL